MIIDWMDECCRMDECCGVDDALESERLYTDMLDRYPDFVGFINRKRKSSGWPVATSGNRLEISSAGSPPFPAETASMFSEEMKACKKFPERRIKTKTGQTLRVIQGGGKTRNMVIF
ncbi:MAG: hypothetical protein C4531_06600 [Desulfurivibrio sp.]|nr:MAG: hypothetical protein C4531_06600 [Desulfurivibrio sp.]